MIFDTQLCLLLLSPIISLSQLIVSFVGCCLMLNLLHVPSLIYMITMDVSVVHLDLFEVSKEDVWFLFFQQYPFLVVCSLVECSQIQEHDIE